MTELNCIQLSAMENSGLTETELISMIPKIGRERIVSKLNPENRLRSLLGELLARYTICQHHNLRNHELSFSYADKGKPLLEAYPDIHFNISHSGQKIACALADKRIGIDIEYYRNVNLQVAKRFFSTLEVAELMELPEAKQLDYFFKLWTMKESYMKALGSGFTRTLNSFSIVPDTEGFHILEESSPSSYLVRSLLLPDHYYLAVCCEHIPGNITIHEVSIEEIKNTLA